MPKIITPDANLGTIHQGWSIQEYEKYSRGPWWYIIMISLGIGLTVYGILSNNFLFSLIIILAGIILFLHEYQDPLQVDFRITDIGVTIGSRLYPYSELNSFYIIYNPPETKTLFLVTKSALRPTLRIPLLEQNPLDVRQLLRRFVNEDLDTEEEPLSDTLSRRWKIQ